MDRREFIKKAGLGAAAVSLASCGFRKENTGIADGSMPSNFDRVSLLGFGAMRWPMTGEGENAVIDQEKVNEMVDLALEKGVNYFDSAPVYHSGKSEEATAIALQRHPRDSYYIATKCSLFREPYSFEKGEKMYRDSLGFYKTDHIDYYLLHALSDYDDLKARFIDTGLLDFFLKEREAGNIRHLGFSFHGSEKGLDSLLETHDKYHWDFVQIQMNYVDWRHASRDGNAEYLYSALEKRGIPVVVMEPLLGGRLAEVPSAVADRLKALEPDKSVASWALRFCASRKGVMTVLSGMTYMEHLQDNLETFLNFKPLTPEENSILEECARMIKEYPLVDCTGCRYCMPCRYGIDIPGIFKFYNRHITEGTYAVSTEQKNYRRIKSRYLLDYSKSVPTVRQADHCIACGQCVHRCPQGIKIPDELRRIDRYLENLKQDLL